MQTSREAHPEFYWALTLLLAVGLGALSTPTAEAATATWAGTGDWFADTDNWSPNPPNPGDDVVISSGSAVVLTNSTPALASLTITNATLTATNWTTVVEATHVMVRNAGLITSAGPFGNAPAMSNRVHIVCTDLTIDDGGAIDVSARGFAGGETSYAGAGPGGSTSAYWDSGGAGHGARGGTVGSTVGGIQYGNAPMPSLPGSAGGGTVSGGRGTHGGGAIRIEAAGHVTINGVIEANGETSSTRSGKGSGGSIWITCSTLSATGGVIRADGGGRTGSSNNTGTGAGGRIAIINDPVSQASLPPLAITLSAMPGAIAAEANRGGMGSLHLIDASIVDDDFSNVEGRIEGLGSFVKSSLTLDERWLGLAGQMDVTITGNVWVTGARARLEIGGTRHWSILWRTDENGEATTVHVEGDMTVDTNANFGVYSGATNNLGETGASTLIKVDGTLRLDTASPVIVGSHHTLGYAPEFRVGSFELGASREITASQRGWRGASGSTAAGGSSGDWWGWGDGAGRQRQGAGYGGIGYDHTGDPARGGGTYGSADQPVHPGSGGGSGHDSGGGGGNGGGSVRIIAGQTITLGENAQIVASGGDGINLGSYSTWRIGGGGSGGGIYLRSPVFHAEAGVQLLAIGGKGARTGYGGGGGRIAVWRRSDTSPAPLVLDPAVHVAGGIGLEGNVDKPEWVGANGTIILDWIPPAGTLILVR